MEQNAWAYRKARASGVSKFNEAAFDNGQALYDGELRSHPFRSVVKTFQVAVWQELIKEWQSLDETARESISWLYPGLPVERFDMTESSDAWNLR